MTKERMRWVPRLWWECNPRRRRNLRRSGGPIHAFAVNHRMNAISLNCEGHCDAIVPMRALVAARRQCVDRGVDGGNRIGTRFERSGRELNRRPRRIRAYRPIPDLLETTLDFRCRPEGGFDRSLSWQRRTQSLESQQRFVRDREQQAIGASCAMRRLSASRETKYVAPVPANDILAVAAFSIARHKRSKSLRTPANAARNCSLARIFT
jgi:hypothetical protein